jgi:flagellar biogenesis protein FliO
LVEILAVVALVSLGSVESACADIVQPASDMASSVTPPVTPGAEINMVSSTITMLGALCFCLGVFAVGVRFLRRFSAGAGPMRRRRIEVREKMALSSKASLFLIAVDNREYLIAQGSDSVSVTPTHSITTPLFAESMDEICADIGEVHV